MATLAPKLPWTHKFARGFPYRDSQDVPTDPDAIDYLNRVKEADGGSGVEVGVAHAIEDFILSCKSSGTWDSLRSACILCGARTLAGSLVSLREYGPNEFVNQTPAITVGGGCAGAYDNSTLTMSVTTAGTEYTRPRFDFDMGRSSGVTYKFEGKLSGDLSKIWRIFFGNTVVATGADLAASDGVFSRTITSNGYPPSFYLDATQGLSSVRIESLSMKEVINDVTNVANNFTSSDYTRLGTTPGLKGGGAKYINTNRPNDADGLNDKHLATYRTSAPTVTGVYAGSLAGSPTSASQQYANAVNATVDHYVSSSVGKLVADTGDENFIGTSLSDGTLTVRSNGVASTRTLTPVPHSLQTFIFGRNSDGSPALRIDARLSFFSIGPSVDLEALDSDVSYLMDSLEFFYRTGVSPRGYDRSTLDYVNRALSNGGTL